VPTPDPVIDTQAEDTTFHQFETQGTIVPHDDDDDDDFGIPPLPPMPPRSHDHEAGSSRAAPAAPPTIDPTLAAILQTLTQQQAHLAVVQQQMSKRMLSMFQTIQDTLQQQLLVDRAENRAFMTHILQHTGAQIPPVQSAPLQLFRPLLCQPFRQDPLFLRLVLLPLRSGRSPWFYRRRSSALSALSH
jgi:hypothetical protein